MEYLSHCFDKHKFDELNNMDAHMIRLVLHKFLTDNPTSKQSGCFFDVGTNAGSFVKILQQYGITKNVHCFEPHPVLANKVVSEYPYVTMNNICLGDVSGEVKIFIPEWSCGISSIINRPVFETLRSSGQHIVEFTAPCITIDQYCYTNNITSIDFIKIDVEGAEKYVFVGAERMLRENRIKSGIFEIGQTLLDAGTSEDELVTMLRLYGYTTSKAYSLNDIYFYKE